MQIDRNIVTKKKKKFIISYYYLLVYKKRKKYVFKNDKAKKNGWIWTLLPHYYPTFKKGLGILTTKTPFESFKLKIQLLAMMQNKPYEIW